MSADILSGENGASLNTTLTQREREYLQAVLAPLPAVRYVRKCTVSAAKERLLVDFRDSNVPLTFPPFRHSAQERCMRGCGRIICTARRIWAFRSRRAAAARSGRVHPL